MNDISQLLNVIDRLSPRIPLSVDLWSTHEIAAYLKRSESAVRDRVVHTLGFPKAIRIPSGTKGRSHPLWKASEVIAWTEKHQERN